MVVIHDVLIAQLGFLERLFIEKWRYSLNRDRWIDRLMDRPSCIDARMYLKICSSIFKAFLRCHLLRKKIDFPFWVFAKSVTHGRTD